jgi:hypothetical protein
MKSYNEFMAAGVPVTLTIGGRLLYIQRSSGGAVLDITFHNGNGTQTVSAVGKGFKAGPVGGFDTITFKAAQDSTVEFIITDGDVNAQFDDASTIIGNDDGQALPIRMPAGQRLPVDLAGGTVNVTATNVGINNTNAGAIPVKSQALTTIVDHDPAVIGTGAAQLLISDATFRRLRVRNAHATAVVALGGSAVTLANAAIVLQPGDIWAEDDAAGAAWYAVSDTAGADVRVVGIK